MKNLNYLDNTSKIDKLKQSLQQLAQKKAVEILKESGYTENKKHYFLRKYEMYFVIYQQLKMAHGLE